MASVFPFESHLLRIRWAEDRPAGQLHPNLMRRLVD
jgi:hypothetical protein